MVEEKNFYYRYEGEKSQQHLKVSRAEGKNTRLNMARQFMGGTGEGRAREKEKRGGPERGPGKGEEP